MQKDHFINGKRSEELKFTQQTTLAKVKID
jgi:hypothetical protein